MTREPITVTTTRMLNGGYECSTIHSGRYLHFRYMGYSKRECERMFRAYARGQGKGITRSGGK